MLRPGCWFVECCETAVDRGDSAVFKTGLEIGRENIYRTSLMSFDLGESVRRCGDPKVLEAILPFHAWYFAIIECANLGFSVLRIHG
jgi:hypothetical protein